LKPVNEKLGVMDKKLTTIETTVNDIRATNRRSYKEIFSRLDYIVADLKRLEPEENKAAQG
jgi:hypothetical protein